MLSGIFHSCTACIVNIFLHYYTTQWNYLNSYNAKEKMVIEEKTATIEFCHAKVQILATLSGIKTSSPPGLSTTLTNVQY